MDKKKLIFVVIFMGCFSHPSFNIHKRYAPSEFYKPNNLKLGCYYSEQNNIQNAYYFYSDGFVANRSFAISNPNQILIKKDSFDIENAFSFGTFTTKNDSLFVSLITFWGGYRSNDINDKVFKIINDSTIVFIKDKCISCMKREVWNNETSEFETDLNIKFNRFRFDIAPDSSKVWIKQRKWFWKNEEEFKQFMKENNF